MKFIENLNNEKIKHFLEKFNFEDYDFEKHDNTLEVRILKNGINNEYFLTDFCAYGNNRTLVNILEKNFIKYLEKEYGDLYKNAHKEYINNKYENQR